MEETIRFTIIIPTYNRAELVKATLDSVLAQEYTNFEAIVVDDGSKDHTEEVIAPYVGEKIKYFKKDNEERAAARNYGIVRAEGAYITFLDSDDLVYPHHFRKALEMVLKYDHPDMFHLAYEMKDPEGKILVRNNRRKGDLNQQLMYGNLLSCIGVFVKKEVLQKNLFNEDRALSGSEDWELWMRLAAQYPIYYTNEITSVMINHDARSVLNVDADKLEKRIQLAYQYLLEDERFNKQFGAFKGAIQAHLYLYLSLHLILANHKKKGVYYAWEALKKHPQVLFTKKFIVILYKLLN